MFAKMSYPTLPGVVEAPITAMAFGAKMASRLVMAQFLGESRYSQPVPKISVYFFLPE
jgi:hypothetical protein